MAGTGAAGGGSAPVDGRGVRLDRRVRPLRIDSRRPQRLRVGRDERAEGHGSPEHEPRTARDHAERALEGTDVFIGSPAPGWSRSTTSRTMNPNPFVLAIANPEPKVLPEDCAQIVKLIATRPLRLSEPGQRRASVAGHVPGALDARAPKITEEMKLAAAHGIAEVVSDDGSPRTTSCRASSTARSARPWRAPWRRRPRSSPRRFRPSGGVTVAGGTGMVGRQVVDRCACAATRWPCCRTARRARSHWKEPNRRAAAARSTRRPRRRNPPSRRDRRAAVDGSTRRSASASRVNSAHKTSSDSRGWPRPSGPKRSHRCRHRVLRRARRERVDESEPPGDDFLAQVVQAWEAEARRAEALGCASRSRARVWCSRRTAARSRRCCRRQARRRRAGRGRPPVRAVGTPRRRRRCAALPPRRRQGHLQRHGARAGHEQGALEGARTRARAARLVPVPAFAIKALYGEMALIVTTGAARGAETARSRSGYRSGGLTSTTPFGQRSAEPPRCRTPRRADDRLLGDPGQGIRGRPAHVGVLPLLLRRTGPLAAGAGSERDGRRRRLAYAAGVLFAIDLVAWHYSIEYIGAGLATVLGNLQVVLVGLTAWVVLSERPRRAPGRGAAGPDRDRADLGRVRGRRLRQ